jgi:hypothetical protein
MGPCQGAVCGPALQHLFGWPPGTVRPPLHAPEVSAWASSPPNRNTGSPSFREDLPPDEFQ